jgi:hypothetical protein
MLHVTKVEHLNGYRLRLEFNNGSVREADLESELWGEVFEPLKSPEIFKLAALNSETGTVEWPNGADLAPEYLYEKGIEVGRAA